MCWKNSILTVVFLLSSPTVFAQSSNELIQVIVAPENGSVSKLVATEIVTNALEASDPDYAIHDEVADTMFLTTIQKDDFQTLQQNPDIVVQKNQYREPLTSASVLTLVGADQAQIAPYNATGSGYATVVIDTGVRATHNFFTNSGNAYDVMTNPSRVTVEHCQSAGFPITDGLGAYILDGSGNKLYEGISTCNGNVFAPTTLSGFTYYSNTIPGTTTSSFGASAPCNALYPGFSGSCRHGSHVAGIAAGTAADYGGTVYSGIAPTSPIISFNVFTKYTDTGICGGGSSCLSATDADILSALSQVEDLAVAGEKIGSVNMSLGGSSYTSESTCTQDNILYYYSFQRLKALGIPVVIATGNNGHKDKISAPGCVSNAYSVGATTITSPGVDEIASYSNTSSFTDYLAPGTSFMSATSDDETGFFSASGTSMATPVVAGAFTALRSLFDGTHAPYPYRSLDAIAYALSTTGLPLDDVRSSGTVLDIPRINIASAIASLASLPYITLPNQSTVNISYPLAYTFGVSSGVAINQVDIVVASGSTASTENLNCTALSASSYNCTITVLSEGTLALTVTDSASSTYTTPVQTFETLPVIDYVSTTTPTGTYSTGTAIPLVAHITGVDSGVRSGSRATALLSNGVSVVLTAANSSSNTLTGSYTVGALGSAQDTVQLKVVSYSNIHVTELDGTVYTNTVFNASTVGSNMDQSGKIIVIDTLAPLVVGASLSQSGSGTDVVPGSTIVLNLTTNKATSINTITINGATPSTITQITPTTIRAQKTVSIGDLGAVVFTASVTDQFGNTSPVVAATTDASTLTMIATPIVASSSGGGGGGGGGSGTPAVLSEKDKVTFCSAKLETNISEGSSSLHVLYAETALQVAGYFGSLPNNDYNSGTALAVKSFQSRYSPSHVTGVIDTQTWELLKFYGGCGTNTNKKTPLVDSVSVAPKKVVFTKTVTSGVRSPVVAVVRTQLAKLGYIKPVKTPSNLLNSSLAKTIKKFQKQNDLPATGKIDKTTYSLLQQLTQ